jgi:hypothetical protein
MAVTGRESDIDIPLSSWSGSFWYSTFRFPCLHLEQSVFVLVSIQNTLCILLICWFQNEKSKVVVEFCCYPVLPRKGLCVTWFLDAIFVLPSLVCC